MQEAFSVSPGHGKMTEAMHLNQPNLISVLRLASNLFTFLESAINSVVTQTYPRFKHVIVDNFLLIEPKRLLQNMHSQNTSFNI